jgi:DNA-binding transcriptional regulator YdaS (Cro superfamily)
MNKTSLQRAIEITGLTRLAEAVGVRPPTIHVWMKSTGKAPAKHVIAIERASGISRHELRPDIYPIETETHEAA